MTDSVGGLVIPREILVRSESYALCIFCNFGSERLQKTCDVIIVTGINILMTSENDVLYIIRKKI